MSLTNKAGTLGSSQLYAVLNSLDVGLLSFDATLVVLLVNDPLGSILRIPAAILQAGKRVTELLETSAALTSAMIGQIAEACQAAVSSTAPTLKMSFSSASGGCRFTVGIGRIGADQWLARFKPTIMDPDAEALALQQAMRDPLTGLCGRPLFQERVTTALSNQDDAPLGHAVMMIGLDRFTAVNDTLGLTHDGIEPFGDQTEQ